MNKGQFQIQQMLIRMRIAYNAIHQTEIFSNATIWRLAIDDQFVDTKAIS